MRTYEAVFIYDPRISEEERNKITEKIEGIINANGTLHETNFWGKKRFAYPIQKSTEGYYYLFVFDAPPTVPAELKRITSITETIYRNMIITRKYRYTPPEDKNEAVPFSAAKPDNGVETKDTQEMNSSEEIAKPSANLPEENQENTHA